MDRAHPPWFNPASFSQDVLYYSLRRIRFLRLSAAEIRLERRQRDPEEDLAIQIIGQAVFTLQVILRRRLKAFFITSIRLISDAAWTENVAEMFDFMAQSYTSNNIFDLILANFAIIAELIVFMDEFGIPASRHSYFKLWCNIYAHRVRNVLYRYGGFRELVKVAERRYIHTRLYKETFDSFIANEPAKHAEVQTVNNMPENTEAFLIETLGALPGPEDRIPLAMNILRKLYERKTGLVPTEEEEQLWVLPY